MISPYPLQWPQGFKRTLGREQGRFKVNYETALSNVRRSLKNFASDSRKQIENPILSSNMNPLTDDALRDPGVAVWFVWDGIQVCIAVDRYTKPAANLQAIHHIIEARRVELRHGTLQLVRQTFMGLKFLPAPEGKHWRDVLGIGSRAPTRQDIEEAHRVLAKKAHPDAGGSDARMAELNNAKETALREIA